MKTLIAICLVVFSQLVVAGNNVIAAAEAEICQAIPGAAICLPDQDLMQLYNDLLLTDLLAAGVTEPLARRTAYGPHERPVSADDIRTFVRRGVLDPVTLQIGATGLQN